MTFDEWVKREGAWLNDEDDASKAARLMAGMAWSVGQRVAREEIAELRAANERFGARQVWWTERMYVLEQERDALKAALSGLVHIYVIDGAATTPASEIGDAWKAAQRALLRAYPLLGLPAKEGQRLLNIECRLCGLRARAAYPWHGRPQGPQCQCNPNTWGNWKRVPDGA